MFIVREIINVFKKNVFLNFLIILFVFKIVKSLVFEWIYVLWKIEMIYRN